MKIECPHVLQLSQKKGYSRLWHWHERLRLGVKTAQVQVLSNLCHMSDCYVTRHVGCESEHMVTELASCKGLALMTSYTTHTSVK